ncbi:MAG: adenylate cyclase [Gammaproteobacteria bacterium]|jgi:adenylate cyclase
MARKTATLTTVFADISGSTRLYETLGDAVARELVSQCLDLMTQSIGKYRGKVVKTIGDEVMCIFATAEAAVRASVAMQEAITDELPALNPNTPASMAIRIGLHHGPIIAERGDVFGDAVNTAARMAGVAKGGQIITTRETVALLPLALSRDIRHLDRVQVKGKAEEIDIFEVIWQHEDVTHIAPRRSDDAAQASITRLHLRYHVLKLDLEQSCEPVILGRGQKADMIVDDSMASREHARVECRRGKFFIADQSTNGTYVETAQGLTYLRREEMQINGDGQLALGRVPSEAKEVVYFTLVD